MSNAGNPLDLGYNARPTDGPFYVQFTEPKPKCYGSKWTVRVTVWDGVINPDGTKGWWFNVCALGHFQAYLGSAKCDGSRTLAYRNGELGSPYEHTGFVMTAQKEEMWSFRWRWDHTQIQESHQLDWSTMGNG